MRRRVQVQLTLMPGAEPWIRVEHAWGSFKLPAQCSIQEVIRGVEERWTSAPHKVKTAPSWYRVSVSEYIAYQDFVKGLGGSVVKAIEPAEEEL